MTATLLLAAHTARLSASLDTTHADDPSAGVGDLKLQLQIMQTYDCSVKCQLKNVGTISVLKRSTGAHFLQRQAAGSSVEWGGD